MRAVDRRRRGRVALALVGALSAMASASGAQDVPVGGAAALGLRTKDATGDCFSPAERARIAAEVADFRLRNPGLLETLPDQQLGTGFDLSFHPMGGRLNADLWPNNYVDLDPGSGVLDWDCTNFTYDGHLGCDVVLRSFLEQDIGVPVFAARSGLVVAVNDGEDDHNTSCQGVANYVVVDHGNQVQTWYAHLRKFSVGVELGQFVEAGEQIGLVGSSGCSTWPHLHFAVVDAGQTVEPWSGPCRTGSTLWDQQVPISRYLYASDFGFSRTNLQGLDPVHGLPRTGQAALSDPFVYFWISGQNLAPNSTLRVRFYRPSGVQEFDSGTQSFGNSSALRWWWWWWPWDLPGLHQYPGTWRLVFQVNGRVLADAPLDVVATADPSFNRPPEPVSLHFSPTNPSDGEAIFCLVDTPLVVDDRDYDVLSFRYVWKVDGQVVRDVVSAGHADAIPAGTARFGQTVACTVTATDGQASAPPTSIQHVMDCLGSETVRVHARMNVYGAGHARPDAPSGQGEGYAPVEIRLNPDAPHVVRFPSVSGVVSPGPQGWNSAEGGTLYGGRTDVASYDGLAGVRHDDRTMFLAGVFLDASEPEDPAPAKLDVTALDTASDLFPALRQVFYVGDGWTGTGLGEVQRFHAPAGATRLVLGFAQAPNFVGLPGSYHDDQGELTVTVEHLALPTCGCAATPYCQSSPNSAGSGAYLSAEGEASLAAAELALRVDGGVPNQFGIFYYGAAKVFLPFGDGVRCVGAGGIGTFRLPPLQIGAGGSVLHPLAFGAPPIASGPGEISAGDTWNFQFWYRDPGFGDSGFNYSDALEISFCP